MIDRKNQTPKQKYRQIFGFYAENLITEYFKNKNEFVISYSWNHMDEWGEKYDPEWKVHLANLFDKLSECNYFKNILNEKLEYYEKYDLPISDSYIVNKIILKARKNKDKDLLKAFVFRDLVRSNTLELLRRENGEFIISEVKAQYGPKPDFRIEINPRQRNVLCNSLLCGVKASLIYFIALPKPVFIEIPYYEIESCEEEKDYILRIRIPPKYRNLEKYIEISPELYTYKNENDLINLLKIRFEEIKIRFEELIRKTHMIAFTYQPHHARLKVTKFVEVSEKEALILEFLKDPHSLTELQEYAIKNNIFLINTILENLKNKGLIKITKGDLWIRNKNIISIEKKFHGYKL